MIAIFIFGALFGGLTVNQLDYNKCKAQNFESKACEFHKKMNDKYGK